MASPSPIPVGGFQGIRSSGMPGVGMPGMPATAASPAPAVPGASFGGSPGVMTTPEGGTVVDLGLIRATSLAQTLAEEARRNGQATQALPMVTGLAQHLRRLWEAARMAKEQTVEPRMIDAILAKRGEYSTQKKAAISQMGGSDAFAQITGVKCHAAASWLQDVLLSTGTERPWGIKPTPLPELPPFINDAIVETVTMKLMQLEAAGVAVTDAQLQELMQQMRDEVTTLAQEKANKASDRMARKMEDQLAEGGYLKAMHDFIDDLVTFPSAILKGPVLRRKKKLQWAQGGTGFKPVVQEYLCAEWDRIAPLDFYPSANASCVEDGYTFERHRLSRGDLQSMIGTPGYDDDSIRLVLDDFGVGGLSMWLSQDTTRADAEGKHITAMHPNTEGLIDALQFFGSVQGRTLREWGMGEAEIGDELAEYDIEAWLIGPYVIKAVINADPLGRKPYYVTSFRKVPGSIWGQGIPDLLHDVQTVCNVAVRSIINNMAIASGPQVEVNVDLLQPGEDVTTLRPWRIWQTKSDPLGNNSAARQPVNFHQPDSNVNELNAVYEKFSQLADEYSGIPRYLTGDTTGGAGRTASGLSMLINNAGKSLKRVIGHVDLDVTKPMLERQYFHNMLYGEDPDLKGDVQIVASGASALIAKEAAQVRRNEFLNATANPIDMQIVGLEGRAHVLRETIKDLGMDVDKIIPSPEILRQRALVAMAQAQAQGQQPQAPGGPAQPNMAPAGSGQALSDGTPTVDNFQPKPNP